MKERKGFTLLEMLVALGISLVLGAVALTFYIQGAGLWQLITQQSTFRSNARNAMNFMAHELQNATRTSSETPSPNLTIPSKPQNKSVQFYLPRDIDDNGFIFDVDGITEWDKSSKIQYQYVPGQKQLRRLEKGEQTVIANDVALIEFEDNSIDATLYANELRITLRLEKVVSQNRTIDVTLTSIVKLRNQ